MSEIVDIMDLDESKFKNLFEKEIGENIDRAYYSGFVSFPDKGKKPNGAIIWEVVNSESRMEDTISEICYFDAQDRDIAQGLLEKYQEMAKEDKVKISTFELKEIKDDVRECLNDNGFTVEEKESRCIRLTVKDLLESKIMKSDKYPAHIIPVADLSLMQFRQWINYCLSSGENGLYEDLQYLPKEWYEEDVSCCAVLNNKILGILLVHPLPDGTLLPVLLFATGAEAQIVVLHMLRYAGQTAEKKYSSDTQILVKQKKIRTEKLMKALFPDKTGDTILYGERKEA